MDNQALKETIKNGGVNAKELSKHSKALAVILLPKKLQSEQDKFMIDDTILCFEIERHQNQYLCKQNEKGEIENWLKHWENNIHVRPYRKMKVQENFFRVDIVERDYYLSQPRQKRII